MNIQIGHSKTAGQLAFQVKDKECSMAAIDEQLRDMAEGLGAENRFLLRLAPNAARAATHCVLSRCAGKGSGDIASGFNARFSRAVIGHMERSLAPLIHGFAGSPDLSGCASQMGAAGCLPVTAEGLDMIAFPVKLGGLGNGLTVFAGEDLSCDAEMLLNLHRRSFKVMKLLLMLDIREAAPRQKLNERELECLQLAGDGLKSEAIADRLELSVHTVNAYLGTATAKLDSVNRIQAIAKAIRLGYLA